MTDTNYTFAMRSRILLTLIALLISAPLLAATADLGLYVPSYYPPPMVDPGGTFTLSVSTRSAGPDPAEHARVTISLPPGSLITHLDPYFGPCTQQGNDLVCDAPGPLVPNPGYGTIILTIQAPAGLDGGIFPISARISSDTPDPNLLDNSWSSTLTVRRLLLVETQADDGPLSLRGRINAMNATCGNDLPCKIVFASDMHIEPLTPLPAVTACNSGFDAGGVAGGPMRVFLDGAKVQSGSGLEIRTNCSGPGYTIPGVTIRRLAIGGFPENGIGIAGTNERRPGYQLGVRHSIDQCSIGTDASGTAARPNRLRGIAVSAPDARVEVVQSTISGNSRSGIAFYSVGEGYLLKNRIGVGTDDRPLSNGASGVFMASGSLSADGNVIAYNHEYGISTIDASVVNGGNIIHANGGAPIDLGINGPSRAGAVQPPVLIDAYYDAAKNVTVIRGHLTGNNDRSPGGSYRVALAASTPGTSPYADAERGLGANVFIYPGRAGAFGSDFETSVSGDLRGQLIVGFTSYADWPDLMTVASSEFSDGITVH